jgi:hypothetical protein
MVVLWASIYVENVSIGLGKGEAKYLLPKPIILSRAM